MSSAKKFKLVVIIAGKGLGSKIVTAAKGAGAQGGTILQGRGTAHPSVYETVLGIAYEPEKELALVGVEEDSLEAVLAAIAQAGKLERPGKGVCFVLDLARVRGVAHLESLV